MIDITCIIFDTNGDTITVPGKWEICPVCQGHGKIDVIGCVTRSEREEDWTDEEWQDYLLGKYDSICATCEGTGKVIVPDWAEISDPSLKKAHEHAVESIRRMNKQMFNERMNGA